MKGIFVYMRNRGEQGKEAAILGISSIGAYSLFALLSIIFSMLGLKLFEFIGVIGSILIGVASFFLISMWLTKIYVKEGRELVFNDIGLGLIFYYILGPISFLLSMLLFFASLR